MSNYLKKIKEGINEFEETIIKKPTIIRIHPSDFEEMKKQELLPIQLYDTPDIQNLKQGFYLYTLYGLKVEITNKTEKGKRRIY
ncbi:MAG: hypothetical protein ACOC5T_02250 [Elusimicrobiota bacterium]